MIAFFKKTNIYRNTRTIVTRVPENTSGLYNAFSMYPPKPEKSFSELGLYINFSTKHKSPPNLFFTIL